MLSIDEIKTNLRAIKPYMTSVYNIDNLYIFGSYARGEQTSKSDIDILVDFKTTPDLLTFIEIEEFLSEKLHAKVDLIPKRKLKHQLKKHILSEAIAI